jgi:hypothetical protein
METQPRKDLPVAVCGICGVVNLVLAYGGLPALLSAGGFSASTLAFVAHPDVFLHYLADIALNPMLILSLHQLCISSLNNGASRLPLRVPSAVMVSAAGAGCMALAAISSSAPVISVCIVSNICCIMYQSDNMQTMFEKQLQGDRASRSKQIADAYIFAQALYLVPAVGAIMLQSDVAFACVPLIDMLGKMGVVQLIQSTPARWNERRDSAANALNAR